MGVRIILASKSEIRRKLLENAGIVCDILPAQVDEEALKTALLADAAPPHDIAHALAELKASKVSKLHPDALVIGCDQLLDLGGRILSKPKSPEAAYEQLADMRGRVHRLLSGAVICQGARPLWHHVGVVQMQMRDVSDAYLRDYIARNWDSIRHCVGAYKLEEEGVRLFQAITGDHFHVMGLPLIEIISFLIEQQELDI